LNQVPCCTSSTNAVFPTDSAFATSLCFILCVSQLVCGHYFLPLLTCALLPPQAASYYIVYNCT
jgi:hypothetical protein